MRVRLSDWARRNYTHESRPASQTLRKMARRGDIPGAFQDSVDRWWVELDAHTARTESAIEAIVGNDKLLRRAIGL